MIKKVLLIVILAGFLLFLVMSGWRIYKRKALLNSRIQELEQEIQALQEKNQALKIQISETETESYWEERLRQQGYKKPGEEVAVVLPPEGELEEETEKQGLWQRLLQKVKFW